MAETIEIPMVEEDKQNLLDCIKMADELNDTDERLVSPQSDVDAILKVSLTVRSRYQQLLERLNDGRIRTQNTPAYEIFNNYFIIYNEKFGAIKAKIDEAYRSKVNMKSALMPHDPSTEIYSDMIYDIKMYEEKKAHLLVNFSEAGVLQFYSGLLQLIKKPLLFVKNLMVRSDNNENFFFNLTPVVRIRWISMMLVTKETNMDELGSLALLERKSKDLVSLLSAAATEVKNKSLKPLEIQYVQIDSKNKFSSYVKNLTDTLKTRELHQLNLHVSNKCATVASEEAASDIFSTIQQAVMKSEEYLLTTLHRDHILNTISNIVTNMYDGVCVVEALLEILSSDMFEIAMYLYVVKRFGLRLFMVECFSRLHRYNLYRKKGLSGG